jgi:acetyl esterase/lipase
MPSVRARLANLAARLLVKRVLNKPGLTIAETRRAMSSRRTMPAFLPRGLRVSASTETGLPGEWQRPAGAAADAVILFLHGGGYVAGSPKTHRSFSSWLAQEAQTPVLSLEYRLAPEHAFPAALDDAVLAARTLAGRGLRVVLAGDSAGAGLAIATALRLRDEGASFVRGLVLVCPLTDLTETSESLRTNERSEPLLGLRHRVRVIGSYAGKTPLRHPYLSPVYADLAGLPPMIVEASRIEVLWDDARRFVDAARAAGCEIAFHPHDGLAHDWQLMVPITPESVASTRRLGGWIAERLR